MKLTNAENVCFLPNILPNHEERREKGWPESSEAQEAAAAVHDGVNRERGILSIRELVLGGTEGDSVWIDSMEFDVELFVPEFPPILAQ